MYLKIKLNNNNYHDFKPIYPIGNYNIIVNTNNFL